jgi:hypothetical protein
VTPSDERRPPPGAAAVERRVSEVDRRANTLRSILKGGWSPRRRAGRRAGDQYLPLDWHDPYLLVLALVMLMLSVIDAFMTVTVLSDGGQEANPILAFVLGEYPRWFAAVKMTLTGVSVLTFVAVARSRLFRVIPVRLIFQGLVLAYLALVAYEVWLVSLMP